MFASLVVASQLADGHDLLGAKINQNGKHDLHKIGNNTVIAEVNNKKVVNMSAGNLPVRKVKSNKKLADRGFGNIRIAANSNTQFAQVIEIY